jgi:hypothetical protein
LLSAEALMGLLSFAIATGLFFGRFRKPTFLKFSHNNRLLEGTGLMIRAPFKIPILLMLCKSYAGNKHQRKWTNDQ